MFNVLYDFQNFTLPGRFPIRPFVGLGVGGAFVHTKTYGQLNGIPGGYAGIENASFDDDKSAFAYQGLAGLTWNVRPNIALDLTGRYFEADRCARPVGDFGDQQQRRCVGLRHRHLQGRLQGRVGDAGRALSVRQPPCAAAAAPAAGSPSRRAASPPRPPRRRPLLPPRRVSSWSTSRSTSRS